MMLRIFAASLLASVAIGKSLYKEAPPTFEAAQNLKWDLKKSGQSRKGAIEVNFQDSNGNPDQVSFTRLDLIGDAKSRGFAHGALLAKDIVEFTGPKLTKYFADEVLNIDISGYPEPLQSILRVLQVKGAEVAPQVFHDAMQWVWEKEAKYVPQNLIDEMDGIAEGVCSVLGSSCNTTEWSNNVKQLNMLPEVIRMACTAFGAWDKATASGGLIQTRALDFGGGPFANYTVLAVHRGDPANPNHAFVSISFPAFVGAITGIAQNGVGISEKVWMTYDKRSLQSGSYDGLADVFVLRDLLEKVSNRAEAIAYVNKAPRTWAMWIGVGDFATQKFDLIGYQQSSAIAYSDVSAPVATGQPYLESIAYVDKHPQPSGEGPTGTLPTVLKDFYGNISLPVTKVITQFHETGDLHIASYDFYNKEMYLSIGRINRDGEYGPEGGNLDTWKAYNRPSLHFNLEDLWKGI